MPPGYSYHPEGILRVPKEFLDSSKEILRNSQEPLKWVPGVGSIWVTGGDCNYIKVRSWTNSFDLCGFSNIPHVMRVVYLEEIFRKMTIFSKFPYLPSGGWQIYDKFCAIFIFSTRREVDFRAIFCYYHPAGGKKWRNFHATTRKFLAGWHRGTTRQRYLLIGISAGWSVASLPAGWCRVTGW